VRIEVVQIEASRNRVRQFVLPRSADIDLSQRSAPRRSTNRRFRAAGTAHAIGRKSAPRGSMAPHPPSWRRARGLTEVKPGEAARRKMRFIIHRLNHRGAAGTPAGRRAAGTEFAHEISRLIERGTRGNLARP